MREPLKMVEFPTFNGSWPWPWIGSYCITSCISRRPLPTYQILLKSKKLFVDGRTDFETGFIRLTRRSRPNKEMEYSDEKGRLVGRLTSHFSTKIGYNYWWQGLGWRFSSTRLRIANDTVTSRPRCFFVQRWPNMGKDIGDSFKLWH